MPSTLQYWSGAAWIAETYLMRFTVTDILGYPLSLEATIANENSTRESTYTDYLKIRVLESDTGLVLFYGKLESSEPSWDDAYGQTLVVKARDNFQELAKRVVNSNYSQLGGLNIVRRGRAVAAGAEPVGLINQIVADHSRSGNIVTSDATKFEISAVPTGVGVLAVTYSGAGKSALQAISDIALEDPRQDPPQTFGYDYYLDTTFAGDNPTPALHYFSRGSRPTGGAAANGLTVEFGGAESAQARSMLADYKFSTESRELVTRVRIDYVTPDGASEQENVILINHGAVTGGPFQANERITWNAGVNAAKVKKLGDGFLIIGQDDTFGTPSSWLNTISGQGITGVTSLATATVNATTGDPPGSLREAIEQDVESVVRGYEAGAAEKALTKAAQILQQGGDTIQRGEFGIINWPYHTVGPTTTLVRAGHVVRVVCASASVNSDMLVTRITFDEGPGMSVARIETVGTTRGRAAQRTFVSEIKENVETSLWETTGATGGVPITAQLVNLSFAGAAFVATDDDDITWGASTATFSDGSTQAINAGSLNMPAANTVYYIYLVKDNAALQTTSNFSDVTGVNQALIACALKNNDSSQLARIVSRNDGSPQLVAGTIIANQLSAISANMGKLTAGRIEVGTGAVGVNFTGLLLDAGGLTYGGSVYNFLGLNAETLQVGIRASTGTLYAGAGAVTLNVDGITIDNGKPLRLTHAAPWGTTSTLYQNVADTRLDLAAEDGAEFVVYNAIGGDYYVSLAPYWDGMARLTLSNITRFRFSAGGAVVYSYDAGSSIGPHSDSLEYLYFYTRNIANSADVQHIFAPYTAAYGLLGNSVKYWYALYVDTAYAQNYYRRSGAGGAVGDATNYFTSGYLDTVYSQDIRRRSGAGGTVGDSSNYYTSSYVATSYANDIRRLSSSSGGSIGDGTYRYDTLYVANIDGNSSPIIFHDNLVPTVSGVGETVGESGRYFVEGYIDTIYSQEIRRRSGAGGDIGTATEYFNNLFVGQSYNKIGGSLGDMDFSVKNTAGNGSVLGLSIQYGDNPVVLVGSAAVLDVNATLPQGWSNQTTVGAAGAANAPPATPEKYLLVKVGATTLAVPAYLAS